MHIGNYVQSTASKDSVGIITGRPPISGCWNVRWTQGHNRGVTTIMQELNLILVSKERNAHS